jgi:hypothetical protein
VVFFIWNQKNKNAGLLWRSCGATVDGGKNGKTRCGATPERVCNAIQSAALSAMKNQCKY